MSFVTTISDILSLNTTSMDITTTSSTKAPLVFSSKTIITEYLYIAIGIIGEYFINEYIKIKEKHLSDGEIYSGAELTS